MPSRYLQRNACLADVPRLVELLIRMDAHVAGVPRARLQLTVAGRQDLHNRFENLIDDPDATVVVATQRGRIVAMGNLQIWRYPDFWRNRERRGRSVAVIDDVWVEPRHRRRGLSRDIVRDLVAFAAIHN